MKKNNLRGLAVSILSIVLIISIGCEGPTGNDGPAGAQGPQGEVGPQGPQGPEGTANVIYSDWIALNTLSAPADTSVLGRNYTRYHIPAEELTQEIINEGAILVYYQLLGMITPLPYTLAGLGGAEDLLVTYAPFTPGRVTILSQLLNNTTSSLNSTTEFRYVLIPGGTAAKQALPDFSNYHETMEFYNIKP